MSNQPKRRIKLKTLEQRVEQVALEVDRVTQLQKRQSRVVDHISRDLELIRASLQDESNNVDTTAVDMLLGPEKTTSPSNSNKSDLDDEIRLMLSDDDEKKETNLSTDEKLASLSEKRQRADSNPRESLEEKRRQFQQFSARIREQKEKLEADSGRIEVEKVKLASAREKLQQVKDKIRRKREERERQREEQQRVRSDTSSHGSVHSSVTDRTFVDEIVEQLEGIHDATSALDAEVVSFTSQDFAPFLPLIGRTAQQEAEHSTSIDDEINLIRDVTDAI